MGVFKRLIGPGLRVRSHLSGSFGADGRVRRVLTGHRGSPTVVDETTCGLAARQRIPAIR
ncbi:hypothetical protein I546_3682 [Mycobacterium kansasii 732]|nr:hypothetical protein I546_3682 [Mycobacterium kansasii 732]